MSTNPHVTLLFSAFQDPNNTIPCEHSEIEVFRESLQGRCRCVAYRNAAELKEKVTEPSAKESGTAQCQTSWHPAVDDFPAKPQTMQINN